MIMWFSSVRTVVENCIMFLNLGSLKLVLYRRAVGEKRLVLEAEIDFLVWRETEAAETPEEPDIKKLQCCSPPAWTPLHLELAPLHQQICLTARIHGGAGQKLAQWLADSACFWAYFGRVVNTCLPSCPKTLANFSEGKQNSIDFHWQLSGPRMYVLFLPGLDGDRSVVQHFSFRHRLSPIARIAMQSVCLHPFNWYDLCLSVKLRGRIIFLSEDGKIHCSKSLNVSELFPIFLKRK